MNVKDFQAGQIGICPACGVKMLIPTESTRPSSREERKQAKAALRAGESQSPLAVDSTHVPTTAASASLFPSTATTFAQSPETPPALAAAPIADPLAVSSMIWYVRPPSGGQFGPATSEIMRSWLAQGRVSVDTLVWREGWAEWQRAAAVFPQLQPSPMTAGLPGGDLEAILEESASAHPHPHPQRPRVPPRKVQFIAFGALAGVFLILLAISLVAWLK